MNGSYVSLFEVVAESVGARLTPIEATKATLLDVSRLLEEIVLREQLPVVICSGFQESSQWLAESEIAKVAHQICIFAADTLPVAADQREIHVTLHGPDPLLQEWFLLVLTERSGALLCARGQHNPDVDDGDQVLTTFWSVEADVIADMLPALVAVVARERPDRVADLEAAFRRFPPPAPDPLFLTLLMNRFIADLGRQRRIRTRLERSLAHAARLRSLGEAVSSVAHELNNPLQTILGFGALLLDEPAIPLSARPDLEHILTAAQHARMIVQNLLQLARSGNDAATAVHIGELIEKALVFVRSDLDAAGVKVTLDLAPNLPAAMAKPIRIQQLLINLLMNAAQALKNHDGPRRLIIAAATESKKRLRLVVQDSGPGIPADVRDQIFEPFFTTKPVGEGTGLGLSIVKAIVDEHDGTIAVTDAPGAGTTFTVRIPLRQSSQNRSDAGRAR